MENLGWTGLLIEPSKVAFEKCRSVRSDKNFFENCALVSDKNTTEVFGDFHGHLMSSIEGKRLNSNQLVTVPSYTLD